MRAHIRLKTYLSRFCYLCSTALNGILTLYMNVSWWPLGPESCCFSVFASLILGILKSVNRSFERFLTNCIFYNVPKVPFSSKKGFKCNVNVFLVPVNNYKDGIKEALGLETIWKKCLFVRYKKGQRRRWIAELEKVTSKMQSIHKNTCIERGLWLVYPSVLSLNEQAWVLREQRKNKLSIQ